MHLDERTEIPMAVFARYTPRSTPISPILTHVASTSTHSAPTPICSRPCLLQFDYLAGVDPDNEVGNRSVDLAKPMGRACGNDDDVARSELTGHTALDSRAARAGTVFFRDLHATSLPGLRIDQRTAG